jgi:hypothetical protein
MRSAAAIAMSCLLLGAGCTAIVRKPSGVSVLADLSLGTATALVVKNEVCQMTEPADICYGTAMSAYLIGGRLLLVGLFAGGIDYGMEPDPPVAEPEPPIAGADSTSLITAHRAWSTQLPDVPTDDATRALPRAVRDDVASGDGAAARRRMERIALLDARYPAALELSPLYESCR